ncbi:uncharacterized protein LOC117828204 isoform X1 [Xyrichtys novacula]|uniref:Uncharacterized protein LOC117828204 isoform X1 n=1 Tax=Xyrichtys novacula TaxID=13765 RepID=A0AAV1HEG2_XYRNO|nr:uncharacterized protein LOC117828204 isoform X1 [Xyrichtys novacula]
MTPPRFDPLLSGPGDAGKWPTDLYKHPELKQTSETNRSRSLWFEGSLKSQIGWKTSDDVKPHSTNTLKMEILPHSDFTISLDVGSKHKHQFIVILEEDPAVIESATYLFQRLPSESTLLRYHKGTLQILRESSFFPPGDHEVVLVGHSSAGSNGTVLSGYDPEELARFVSTLKYEGIFGSLQTISIISCNLGNDKDFILQLLQVLRSLGVETKLNLYDAFLSISADGKILTKTEGVWRSHDHRTRVTAELDQTGDLEIRAELGCAGQVLPNHRGSVLFLQTLNWPRHPQMFVPRELRKKYPSIDCLEGLTWSLFFETERRRAPDYVPQSDNGGRMAVWLQEPGPNEDIVIKQINNIQDLLVEIRYNAREEVRSDLYYVLNECIYRVQAKNLSVTLVGKFMSSDNQAEIENFRLHFNEAQNQSSLQELREGLKPAKFNDFCRQTFQYQQCSYNCERWGRYFMSAVFSASVINFRTFSLFLMSVIGCEVGRSRGMDSTLCTAFVGSDHPMETENPHPEGLQRGFYGCSVDSYEMAPQEKQVWLDKVVAKENALYVKSKQMMNNVDHDEQTELDIFGKVKVMNKYVFSSYLEFFRGTPEGRKLKRGCAPSFNNNYFKP